jgi:DNA-binding NarL/FixJ family response regulator
MPALRRLIHVSETGYVVIVPTERELIAMLQSKTERAKSSMAALFHAFGFPPAMVETTTAAEKEVVLREEFAKYTGRRMAETRHVPTPRVVTGAPTKAASPLRSAMASRAAAVRKLLKRGLSQAEAARQLGLSQPYISQLLRRTA